MKHVDLCSGIGGFALAAQWAGWKTVGFCEIDPWCQQLLAKRFPGVAQHDDIKTLKAETIRSWLSDAVVHADCGIGGGFRKSRCDVDTGHGGSLSENWRGQLERAGGSGSVSEYILTAGYPCQPFSVSGRRAGEDDSRHIWPWIRELLTALGETKPAWCVFENVVGHVSLGLDSVLADLEAEGYACWPAIIPAAAVGALHRRDRVWIVAYRNQSRLSRVGERKHTISCSGCKTKASRGSSNTSVWQDWSEVESGLRGATDGLSAGMDHPFNAFGRNMEYAVSPTTTESPEDRVARVKALGNAIVPQVAYVIFDAINEARQREIW